VASLRIPDAAGGGRGPRLPEGWFKVERFVPKPLVLKYGHLGAAIRVSGLGTIRSTIHWKQRRTTYWNVGSGTD